VLKDYYLEPVREQLNQKAVLMFAADDDGEPRSSNGETFPFRGLAVESEGVEFAGRQWVMSAHVGRNEGVGAINEGGTLPKGRYQVYEDLKDTLRHNVGVIELTRFAIRLSRRKPGAFLRLLEAETKGMVKDIRKDVSRQAYGDGTGTLAVWAAEAANTITVDTIQYLRVGMYIDFVDSTGVTVQVAERKITAINATTKVVTYDGADASASIGAGTKITRTGSSLKEINGLAKLIDDTGTIHSVDSTLAQNAWWKSVVMDATVGGSPGQFSEDLGQQVVDRVGSTGNAEVALLLTTRGVRRRYVNQLKSQKRFNDKDSVTLRGGFKAILFNEMPLVFDDDCPKGKMWFLEPDALMWIYLDTKKWDWVDDDGAILSRKASREDAFEAYLAADHDLAVNSRNQLGVIENLEDDAAQPWG
jgi:hypothetical protein